MGSDSRPAGLVRLQRPGSSLPHHHSASAKLYFFRFSWHPLRVCFLVPTILFPCCHSRPVFVSLRVWTQRLLSWCLIVLDRKAGLELGNLEKYDSWSVVSSSLLLFSHFISLLIHPLQPPQPNDDVILAYSPLQKEASRWSRIRLSEDYNMSHLFAIPNLILKQVQCEVVISTYLQKK